MGITAYEGGGDIQPPTCCVLTSQQNAQDVGHYIQIRIDVKKNLVLKSATGTIRAPLLFSKSSTEGLLIMKRSLLVLVLISIVAPFAYSQANSKHVVNSKTKIEEQLKAMYEKLLVAIKVGDIKAYNQLLTDKYIFTSGGRGIVLTKGERAKEVGALRDQIEQATVQSYHVYLYGSSAVGSFVIQNRGVSQGEAYDSMINVTVAYVKIGPAWKIAATHTSLIPTNK